MYGFVNEALGETLHAKRVLSLSRATTGVIHAAALGVNAIGRALALSQGTLAKHGIKQVDRLLSNPAIEPAAHFGAWVPFVWATAPRRGSLSTGRTSTRTITRPSQRT